MNYKNFFKACEKNLYFDTERGTLSVYDLFRLPEEELKQIYIELKQKAVVDDDPILAETSNGYKEDLLKFEIVKDIILYRQEKARKNELLAKKRQLEDMLNRIKMKQLEENPEAIMKELDKIRSELDEEEGT